MASVIAVIAAGLLGGLLPKSVDVVAITLAGCLLLRVGTSEFPTLLMLAGCVMLFLSTTFGAASEGFALLWRPAWILLIIGSLLRVNLSLRRPVPPLLAHRAGWTSSSLVAGSSLVLLLSIPLVTTLLLRPQPPQLPMASGATVGATTNDTVIPTMSAAPAPESATPAPSPASSKIVEELAQPSASSATTQDVTATIAPAELTETATLVPASSMPLVDTPTPELTPVPEQPTPTKTPTAKVGASSTPTATPRPTTTPPPVRTPTPTPTRAPTAPPRRTLILYPAVIQSGSVVLWWSLNGELGPNETYDVRAWRADQPANSSIANTDKPRWAIGAGFQPGDYSWTIAVIQKSGKATVFNAGSTLTFHWAGTGG